MADTLFPEPRAATGAPDLDKAVADAAAALIAHQRADGHWLFALEADATIPAEYILLSHHLGEIDNEAEALLAPYLRRTQGADGGWPLFYGGAMDLSASVKAYFALKAAGDDQDAPHMARARAAILAAGGAAKCNVFTRILLALFGELPWRAVPVMPVEIMLLPRWFPFHMNKIAYWSRTVIAPLLVLMAKRPLAKNPKQVHIAELLVTGRAPAVRAKGSPWALFFNALDSVLRVAEPMFPKKARARAIDAAVAFVRERLNGEDGLGGIYPAMANAVMMFDCLGLGNDPAMAAAKAALRKLMLKESGEGAMYQPCVSPVWDTGLASHALMEVGDDASVAAARRGLDWLAGRQVVDRIGDWAVWRPGLEPGGWAFQYANAYYPDIDDTAMAALALDRGDRAKYRENVARAAQWVAGMRSKSGGWAAYDADNEYFYLNFIPFADHNALLDPPSADVSARCVGFLAQLGSRGDQAALRAGINYLRRQQEPDGSWFGRWGTNYIYGTWSALVALAAVGVPREDPMIRRAVRWLRARQRADGGWAEDGVSYYPGAPRGEGNASTASQTAWALLALMAAGEGTSDTVERGVKYLLETQARHGLWDEPWYTAVGFPRVFYLRYHGYRAYFPLWALARYRNLCRGGYQVWGM
jgi:squalene-hopene/tetraprenyl-beta-curcumene cyclase